MGSDPLFGQPGRKLRCPLFFQKKFLKRRCVQRGIHDSKKILIQAGKGNMDQ
jgi:hypothetical protein